MPSHMIINTESIVGYNNKLKRVNLNMKFCVNLDVNIEQRTRSWLCHQEQAPSNGGARRL